MSKCEDEVFSGCKELKVVSLPEDTESIGASAFYGCEMLNNVYIPSSVSSLGDSAFTGCKKLRKVAIKENASDIGTSAFADCSMLLSVDRFGEKDASHPFNMVGDYAFAGTSLSKANLSLRSSSIYTFWGDYCFAGCTNLTEANVLSACYMSNHMFANDTQLTAVNFKNNHTSYVYPYVFENCTSLPSITLPSKIWYVSEGMFHNCSSLKTVAFSNYEAANSMVSLVQRNAFNGCTKLQSIEFPASLNALNQFKDACLSSCAATALNFHGLGDDVILSANNSVLTSDLMYGQIYYVRSNHSTAEAQVRKIVEISEDLQMPVVFFLNEGWWLNDTSGEGGKDGVKYTNCGTNASAHAASLQSSDTTSQLAKIKAIFVWIDNVLLESESEPTSSELNTARQQQITDFSKKTYTTVPGCLKYLAAEVAGLKGYVDNIFQTGNKLGAVYGSACAYVNKGSTKSAAQAYTKQSAVAVDKIITKLENMKKYQTQTAVSLCMQRFVFAEQLQKNGLFRLCHNCSVWTADHQPTYSYGYLTNEPYTFTYDASKVTKYVEPTEYTSDSTTTSNFKTGKWYYNSEQIKAQADSTHTPCLFIYSLLGCKPCQVYQENIWNNAEFQAWAAKQKFLLCGMEVTKQPYYDKSLKFCVDELSPSANNYQKLGAAEPSEANGFDEKFKQTKDSEGNINSNLYTPVIVFYYNNGTVTKSFDYTYHSIDKWISQVGVQGVIQCLKSLCLKHFDNNTLAGAKFVVDAGKAFDKSDYIVDPSNPYKKADNLITLNRWSSLTDFSIAGVKAQMKKVLENLGSESSSYPEYIGGCLWSDFDWIEYTFDVTLLQEDDASVINAELNRFYIEIGTTPKYYKMSVSSTDKKASIETPCGPSTIYKYIFTETTYPG